MWGPMCNCTFESPLHFSFHHIELFYPSDSNTMSLTRILILLQLSLQKYFTIWIAIPLSEPFLVFTLPYSYSYSYSYSYFYFCSTVTLIRDSNPHLNPSPTPTRKIPTLIQLLTHIPDGVLNRKWDFRYWSDANHVLWRIQSDGVRSTLPNKSHHLLLLPRDGFW